MKNILLPKNSVEQKLNREQLPEYCKDIKKRVEELYESGTTKFILQDGPAFLNNFFHIGHFLNKTLKDFYIKYYLINGYKVEVRFGGDCHGLPIENKAKQMEGELLENCKNIALHFQKEQKKALEMFGIFFTEQNYLTMDDDFKERELKIFNKLNDGGFIYKKKKPTWYSPTLGTVLANSEIEYKDLEEEAVYFKLPGNRDTYFLVWTTTEWTLAANQAICMSPSISYCRTEDNIICSEKFAMLNGLKYQPIDVTNYRGYYNHNKQNCSIIFDDYVTDTETGIVHLCGGHGDEDCSLLLKHGITPRNAVEDIKDLENHIATYKAPEELVYRRVKIKHSYPVDWREKNKVFKVLTEQTYLDFDWAKIKAVSKQIKLSGKDRTRLEGMLFSRKDWCLSRQRKWGVQIPDSNDILDVWFDSGTVFSMYDEPADLYLEGVDQHRGWFQSSIIIAAMVDRLPTKRILTHGFVTNEFGEKYAKSMENYTPLEQMYNEYNPDVMRLWVLFSDYKSDVVLSDDAMKSAGKQYFKLRNFMRYLVNNLHRDKHSSDVRFELKESVRKLKESIAKYAEEFELNKAVRTLVNFTNEYSSYLSEDKKNAFYESDINGEFRIELENEFHYVATELVDVLFPFMPFLYVEIKTQLEK